MKRYGIAIRFKKHGSIDRERVHTVFAESFEITSRGYVNINYFDGGCNCVYRAEDMICAYPCELNSLFSSEEELNIHKEMYPSLYNPMYNIQDSF